MILFVSNLVTMLGVGMVAPFMSLYAERLGASGLGIGFIFGSFALARGIGTPVFGRLSDLSGRKRFIVAGLFFFSVLSALYPFARDAMDLVIIRFFQGLASCVVTPIAMAYVVEQTSPEAEGESLGTFSISLFAGMAIGPLVGGWISHQYSMDAAFYTISLLSACTLLFVLWLLPPSAPRADAGMADPAGSIFDPLIDPQVRAVCLFRFANAVIISSIMGFLPLLAEDRGVKLTSIGLIFSGFLLFSGFLQRPFGKMADRLDRSRMIVIGQLLHVFGLGLMTWMTSRAGTWVPLFFMSVGTGLAVSAATAESGRLGRQYGPGALIGLFNTAMSLGTAVGPLLAGLVYDHFGLRPVFLVLGVVIFAATFPFLVPGEWAIGRRSN
ncbi:MFS transporter [bacterium]|nr:MFS transporter [bacterium]